MKKICFFSGDITRSGGTERVAAMIADGLLQMGYQVCVLSLVEQSKKPFFQLNRRIRHYALGRRWIQPGPGYIALIPKLRRFLEKKEIDVIIDIDIVLDVLSVPAAFATAVKVISWEHFNYGYEVSAGYRKMIVRHVTPRSDYIVTLTEGDRASFIHRMPKHPKVCVIHNPMQPAAVSTAKKKQWIITTGRLTYQKGMDYLVRTADLVLKKYPDWTWLVLGDGQMRGEMEAEIKEFGLEGRLILIGQTVDVDAYLRQAQIFVLTSRGEGLPMSLLEAKAHRLPCVSFDIATGPDEIIDDGVNGFLIPAFSCRQMAQRIGQLIEDDRMRHDFSKQAELGTEKFQMASILRQWDEVLKQVCG